MKSVTQTIRSTALSNTAYAVTEQSMPTIVRDVYGYLDPWGTSNVRRCVWHGLAPYEKSVVESLTGFQRLEHWVQGYE